MKWEAIVAMVALFLLGAWLVYAPGSGSFGHELRRGAVTQRIKIGAVPGRLEYQRADDGGEGTYRLLFRGSASEVLERDELVALIGPDAADRIVRQSGNAVFRLLRITNWGSLIWIGLGLGGQIAFFARMGIQWIVSERRGESIVPPAFWYLSLAGGVALFVYFVWRQDIIGVMGQTTGVVIYARNIRLIHKQREREHDEDTDAGAEPATA